MRWLVLGYQYDNRAIKQLALQGPALLERVNAAKVLYGDLSQAVEKEKVRRAKN